MNYFYQRYETYSKHIPKFTSISLCALLFVLSCAGIFSVPLAHAIPRSQDELNAIEDKLVNTGLSATSIPSLYNPEFMNISEASMSLEAQDVVFVVPLEDDANTSVLIIPQKILLWHEVINLANKDYSLVITYSPASGSLVVYDTKVGSRTLYFDINGQIYNTNTILVDRNTGSLWSQLYGMSILGPLQGIGLLILPSYWTTWDKARDSYLDDKTAQVLKTPRTQQRYGQDPYGSYLSDDTYYQNDTLIYPLNIIDTRLRSKTPILGIELNTYFMAIDIEYVKEKKYVNFYMGLTPLLAYHDEDLGVVRVYNRDIWPGKTPAIFRVENNTLIDIQTKSVWSVTGECISGNLQGIQMEELFGAYSFWFVWAAHNPETDIIPGQSEVPESALDYKTSLP